MESLSVPPISDDKEDLSSGQSPDQQSPNDLELVRRILFDHERERIVSLEQRAAAIFETLKADGEAQNEVLRSQIDALLAELEEVQQTAVSHQQQATHLQNALNQLQTDFRQETDSLIPRLTDQMGDILQAKIIESRDEMAEALGPVMGDAIRVQIRDSRDEMVEALYPIIISTVQRAIAEFSRELQENIDNQLKSTLDFQGFWRRRKAQLTGIPLSQLQLRDALSFNIREIFIIQHETGLLLAHKSNAEVANFDKDLISGMLTAIRNFARDSFSQGSDDGQLSEIQYDNAQITIQSGQYVYLAIVTTGVEPEWYRSQLRTFIAELHIDHAPALRDFEGDDATLPPLAPRLDQLWQTVLAPPELQTMKQSLSRNQKWAIGLGSVGLLLFLALACFYLQFTIALLPAAFGNAPAATATPVPSSGLTTDTYTMNDAHVDDVDEAANNTAVFHPAHSSTIPKWESNPIQHHNPIPQK